MMDFNLYVSLCMRISSFREAIEIQLEPNYSL